MSRLADLIGERGVLLADGGMGTGLFARGLTTGDSPELWNIVRPEAVLDVHRGFIAAGSDLILTNSFGANRQRLKLHGAEARVVELNGAAAGLARQAADESDRAVLVAGSIGPTGDLLEPLGALTAAEAHSVFAEQAKARAAGGVDLLWIETMSAADEIEAAATAAAETGLPVVVTLSFDTNGRTMMGLTPAAAVSLLAGLGTAPQGVGANCGTGPGQLLATVLGLVEAAGPSSIIVAKGNCGIPEYRDGHIHYSGTPEIMATYAAMARAAGAQIVGGCCGTQPVHLRAMRAALDGPPVPVPDLAMLNATLGPVIMPTATETGARRRRARG